MFVHAFNHSWYREEVVHKKKTKGKSGRKQNFLNLEIKRGGIYLGL